MVVVVEAAVAATVECHAVASLAAECHAAASHVAEWARAARVGAVLILTVLAILTVPAIGAVVIIGMATTGTAKIGTVATGADIIITAMM